MKNTKVNQLNINMLTRAQYDEANTKGQINTTELYMITDETEAILDEFLPLTGGNLTGNLTVNNKAVVLDDDARLSDSRNAKDVYDWAKASVKPTYTASEVGAMTNGEVSSLIDTKISALVDSAPEELNTLKELATAIQGNQSTITAINNAITSKADKATTYTKTEVDTELAKKANTADVFTKSETYSQSAIDTSLSLKADKATTLQGYGITDAVSSTDSRLSDARRASDVYEWAKAASKPTYSFSEITNVPTTVSGYGISDVYTKTQIDEMLPSGGGQTTVKIIRWED